MIESKSQVDDFLDLMDIIIKKGDVAQYCYGDNLNGYFENFLYSYHRGIGYVIGREAIFKDYETYINNKLLDRKKAKKSIIKGTGIEIIYKNNSEEKHSLINKKRIFLISIETKKKSNIKVKLYFNLTDDSFELIKLIPDNGYLYKIKHNLETANYFMVYSDKKISYENNKIKTINKEKYIKIYLLFGYTLNEIEDNIEFIRNNDVIEYHKKRIYDIISRSFIITDNKLFNKALFWSKLSGYFFLTDEFCKGIWAGLPWFKDNWGRDTFISLPGILLVNGFFEDALEVIKNFIRFQNLNRDDKNYGRIPNRIASKEDIIYNTVDGTLWLIREFYEYLCLTGDFKFLVDFRKFLDSYFEGAFKYYVDDKNFLTHDDADTWMDARIEGKDPWSPRGNRANDIEALWWTALMIASSLFEDPSKKALYKNKAEELKENFLKYFYDKDKEILADRITKDDVKDLTIRPNQLMCITVPSILNEESFLDEDIEKKVIKRAVRTLLLPYGIMSLDPDHPDFHPYHIDENNRYHKDAAYHNGTIWGWNAGFVVSSLLKYNEKDFAFKLTKNLAKQIIEIGCRGTMSECLNAFTDKDGNITPTGTFSQAWSVSEFCRNAFQDYLGFRPYLLNEKIILKPDIPSALSNVYAKIPYGTSSIFYLNYNRKKDIEIYEIELMNNDIAKNLEVYIYTKKGYYIVNFKLVRNNKFVIERKKDFIQADGDIRFIEKKTKIKGLKFAKIDKKKEYNSLKENNYLRNKILFGENR